jgi:uncharacterized protein YegL
MSEQVAFGTSEFADNPEPRCPCVLLLDTSYSMNGQKIDSLNGGITTLKSDLAADGLASKRVELATITFGGTVQKQHDFQNVIDYYPSTLKAEGDTPMGEAIEQAVELVRLRKETYRANGILYFRPWIFLITDGEPTDGQRWRDAAALVHQGETSQAFSFFAVGVAGADMGVLRQISTREPVTLVGLKFREMFIWLSNSLKSRSRRDPSTPAHEYALDAPRGWAQA